MKKSYFIATAVITILVSACSENPPVASFITDADSYYTGDTIYFQSTCQNATSFDWNFADGTGSAEENPTHVYTEEGKFTVVLLATNEDGSDETSKTITVNQIYPCWTELASLPEPRQGPVSVSYNDLVYIIPAGGLPTVKMDVYDPATDEWTT